MKTLKREYSNKISLTKNSRGIYSLDTSIWCSSWMKLGVWGCYNECYAAKSSKLYGYDFSKTVFRDFENERHIKTTIRKINNVKLDFIRIWTSWDPSENWKHTIKVLKDIDKCNKEIVIITKHWTTLQQEHLEYLSKINVCINTSVSALDDKNLLEYRIKQFERLKPYCKSILRIVSCDFNTNNTEWKKFDDIQHNLFKYQDTIDTVFRVSKGNKLVTDWIINVSKTLFLWKNALVSKLNKNTYFWKCENCYEMCGVNMKPKVKMYPDKKGITKQLLLFKKSFSYEY